jgi:hypothetical protein
VLRVAADAGFAGVGSETLSKRQIPIEVIMASAKPKPKPNFDRRSGRYWARTSDPQLVELVLSQLS